MKRKILILMLIVLLLTGCGKQDIPELISPAKSIKSYFTVKSGNISNQKVSDGYIVPMTETVYFEMDGTSFDLAYKVGDKVNEGDVILSLYENIDDELASLESQLEDFQTISDCYVKQHENEISEMKKYLSGKSGSDYELYKVEIETKKLLNEYSEKLREKEYEALSAQYADLLEKKDKSKVVAPCSGTIAYLAVKGEGEFCQNGYVACIIADDSSKIVQFDYETKDFFKSLDDLYIKIGNEIYEDISFVEYTDKELNYSELYGHTIYSRAVVEGLPEDIESGTYCAVYQSWDTAENVLYVPNESIFTDTSTLTKYCMVLNEEKEEERVTITCGIETESYTEVIEGLSEGQLVYHTNDLSSWTSDQKTTEAYLGDYSHYLKFDGAYKAASASESISLYLPGKVDEILLDSTTDIYVEADTPIFVYTAEIKESEYEQAKLDYESAANSYDSSIESYDAQITDKEEMLDNATNDIDITILKSEIENLKNGRDDFVKELDENLAALEDKYNVYEAAFNGESITVKAPASGILGIDTQLLFVGAEITAEFPIGSVSSKDSFLCYSPDYLDITEESGNIYFGQKATVSSNVNGQIYDTSVTAYSTKNIVTDAIWNNSMNQHVVFRLDNQDDAVNVYSLSSSVTVNDINISDVVLIDNSFIYNETIESEITGETERLFYVYVKSGDYICKRYVEPASYSIYNESATWIKTGLSAGEVCVKVNS